MKHLKGRMDESILVCVYYGLNGERLIRRGHKLATLLDCPLYVLTVDSKPLDTFDVEKSGYIEQWKQLAEELQVEEFILKDNEKRPIQKVINEVARDYEITQIIVGQSAQSRWEEITKGSFLNVLLKEEKCVSDISNTLNISQSAISHQLRILKTSKLVKYTKKGKEVYYSLLDNHVQKIFELGCEHINEI